MEQTSINAVIALGITYVILSGGIDLSVGSLLALSGVVLATALQAGWPAPVAIAVGMAVGGACGLLNGLLITRGRLPPFIATLGMMSIARGAALVFTSGRPISGFDASFRQLSTARVLGIPILPHHRRLPARALPSSPAPASDATSTRSAATRRPRA